MMASSLSQVKKFFANRPDRVILCILIIVSLLRGIVFAGIIPAFQAPDEMTHAAFVEVVATEGRLPLFAESLPPVVRESLSRSHWWPYWRAFTLYSGPSALTISAAAHPPLYYLIAAPFFLVTYGFGDAVWIFVLRMLGVVMAAGVVYFAFKTVQHLFPKDRFLQLLVPMLIIVQPQLGFITSSINNDCLVILLGSALVYLLVCALDEKANTKRSIWTGLVLGAGLLTKASFMLMAPITFGFLLVVWLFRRASWPDIIKNLAVVGAGTLVVGGWWYIYNLLTVGSLVPVVPPPVTGNAIKTGILGLAISPLFIKKIFIMFWADFGWLSILLDDIWYRLLIYVSAFSLIGYAVWLIRRLLGKVKSTREQLQALALFTVTSLAVYLGVTQFEITTQGGAQGRYMFMVIVPIMVLLAFGFRSFVPKRAEKPLFVLAGLAGTGFLSVCLFFYIVPYYYG